MKVSELPYRRVTREEMTEGLQRVIGRVKAAQSVEEILAARAEYLSLTTEYATAQSLSYMRYTINTVDPFYLAEKDYYDEIGPEVENLALQYTSAVLDSPFRKELETVLSPILLRSMELQRRSMSPEIIDDMVEENKIVSEYAQLMAGMLFPFRGEQLPRPMLMKYARSADRATRRECYEALGTTLEAHSAQLDDLFDRLVHVRDRMAKKMGYENFIELGYCRMERMCYDAQAVQTFRENIVRDIVPVVSRLRLENAKRLGIDTFRLYDNEFFTPGGDPTPCGKDDLFAAAQKMYDAMGDVPGAFFRMMCENEAFDVESRPNKWGGGYCTEFPKFRQPFILANFNGTSGDVDVVTHEAGHALNAYLIADNRFALELGCGGMETAETHSMSMEFFAWPYLDAFFPKAGDAERYRFQHALDAIGRLPFEEQSVDAPHHLRFFRHDLWLAVLALAVTEEVLVGHGNLAVCEALPLAPCHVFRDAAALFLCKAGHDRDEQLTLGVQRIDVFFLEVHLDALFLELTHGGQAVHSVAGKAGNGLGDDEVDFPGQCVGDHLVEALAPFGVRAGDALVGVHPGERPVGPFLDVMGVVVHLRLIAGKLLLVVRGYTGIGRHPELAYFIIYYIQGQAVFLGWNNRYICCCLHTPALLSSGHSKLWDFSTV